MERKYAAFISYRHTPLDMAVAKRLHTLIEQYRISDHLQPGGRKRFGLVFRDEEELSLSSDLSREIRDALDRTEHLIVVCSPRTAESAWVTQEIRYFLEHHSRDKVFLVVAEGDPQQVFPPELTRVVDPADGSVTHVEPLSANVQAENPRQMRKLLDREVLRLFAAMLGCPYDELVQREQKRQRRRIIAAASAVLAVALSFSGMLLVKNRQIQQANQELARQKAEVQLRESELLTQNAWEAIAEADYGSAIASAVAALPDGTGDRPYYAPAEQALISGLRILEDEGEEYVVVRTAVEQMTNISNMLVSGDGTRLVTFDPYGTLHCCDTRSTQLLWSQTCTGAAFMMETDNQWPLLPLPDGRGFICCGGGKMEARDFASGQLLWQAEHMVTPGEACMVLSDDGKLLAFQELEMHDDGAETVFLRIYSTEDGRLVKRLKVAEYPLPFQLRFSATNDANAKTGAFSPDGRRYISHYIQGNDPYTLYYYEADLETGAVRILRSETMPGYYSEYAVADLSVTPDGTALLATRYCPENECRSYLEKIDAVTGGTVWQTEVEPSEDGGTYFRYDTRARTVHADGKAYVYLEDMLYAVDTASGGIEWILTVGHPIKDVVWLMEDLLGVTDESGCFSLVQVDEDGPQYAAAYGVEIRLGSLQAVQPWNGGILTGFTVTVPADNARQLLICRLERPAAAVESLRTELAGEMETAYGQISGTLLGDTLYLFPLVDDADEEDPLGSGRQWCVALDSGTLEEKYRFPATVPWGYSGAVSSDGGTFLVWDTNGEIAAVDAKTGEQQVLSEMDLLHPYYFDSFIIHAPAYASNTARRTADNQLLTARCGAGMLTLWTDGADETQVPLPEGLIWEVPYQQRYLNRMLAVGGSGYIVISEFADDADGLMDGFASYDPAGGSWVRFADAGDGERGRRYCMGQREPLFAAVDQDGTARIYDLTTGAVRHTLSLGVPANSVEQILFGWDDRLLVVKNRDEQLCLYDIGSGELLYRQEQDTASDSRLHVYGDDVNHRLYIVDETVRRNSLCLDTRSWTKLADIPGLLCFDEASGCIWRCPKNWRDEVLRQRLPATGELTALGRQILGLS